MVYEIVMACLAIVAVSMLFLEPAFPDYEHVFHSLDMMILGLFAVDYFLRLYRARDKRQFLLHNIPDLIAIIPFNSLFRSARLVRLVRFTRFSKFSRTIRFAIYAQRFVSRCSAFFKTNGLHYMIFATAVLIIVGAGAIYSLEHGLNDEVTSVGDALWWSLVTTTTVGYGDVAPVTASGRVLAGVLMVFGIGFVGMVTATIATFFIREGDQEQTANSGKIDEILAMLDRLEQLNAEEIHRLKGYIQSAVTRE